MSRVVGVLVIVLLVLALSFGTVSASEYLTNPSFTGGVTGWTLAYDAQGTGSIAYDSAYYQDTAGSAKGTSGVGKKIVMQGYYWQEIGTDIDSGDTVTLSLQWSKESITSTASGVNIIKVQIALPSTPNTWVDIWSDVTIPTAGAGATAWTGPNQIDASGNFTETGTYKFRIYYDLKSGNNNAAEARAWFDSVSLDVTGASDTTAPSFSSYAESITPNEDQNVDINVTVTEANTLTFVYAEVLLDGTNYTATNTGGSDYGLVVLSANYTAHDNVQYKWWAQDDSGNLNGSATQSFTVANQAPSNPSSSSLNSSGITHSTTPATTWTNGADNDAEDALDTFTSVDSSGYTITGDTFVGWNTSANSITLSGLSYGNGNRTYWVSQYSDDGYDNSTGYNWTFVLNNTQPGPPSAANLDGQTTSDTTPTITFTKGTDSDTSPSDTVTQYWSIDDTAYTETGSECTGSGDVSQFTCNTLDSGDMTYYASMWTDDGTGTSNSQSTYYNFSFTLDTAVDNTAPSFSNYAESITPNEDQNVDINVTVTDASTVAFVYAEVLLDGTNYTATNVSAKTDCTSGSGGCDFGLIMESANYTAHDNVQYKWWAQDTVGNLAGSATQSFTVANQAPSNPSSSSLNSSGITHSTTPATTWTNGADNDAEDALDTFTSVDSSGYTITGDTFVGWNTSANSITLSGLSYGNGNRTYWVSQYSDDGYDNSTGYNWTFVLNNTQPTAPSAANLDGGITSDATPLLAVTEGTDADTSPSDTLTCYITIDSTTQQDYPSGDLYNSSAANNCDFQTTDLGDSGLKYVRMTMNDGTGGTNENSTNYDFTFTLDQKGPYNATANDAGWATSPENAYLQNGQHAQGAVTELLVLSNYNINIPSGYSVDDVEVGIDYYTSSNKGRIDVQVSGDGGTTYTTLVAYTIDTTNDNTIELKNMTDISEWTDENVTNANFRVRVEAIDLGNPNPTFYLDYASVKVYYSVSDNTLPTLSLDYPANNTYYDPGNWTWINGTITDNIGVDTVWINDTSIWNQNDTDGDGEFNITNTSQITDGWRSISILGNDTSNNINSIDVYFYFNNTESPVDTNAPAISGTEINNTGPTNFNYDVRINASISDAEGNLDSYLLEVNRPTSSDYNITMDSVSGTEYEKNITINEAGIWYFKVFANDTVNNGAWGSQVQTEATAPGVDTTLPTWQNQLQNATTIEVGHSVKLYAQGRDETGFDWAILSTNESGTWVNYTDGSYGSPMDVSAPADTWKWSNFTWNNPSKDAGAHIGWRIWYNDTTGNWNGTDIATFDVVKVYSLYMPEGSPPTTSNWSMIGWPFKERSLTAALSNISGSYSEVYTWNATNEWSWYEAKYGGVSHPEMLTLKPGWGYYINYNDTVSRTLYINGTPQSVDIAMPTAGRWYMFGWPFDRKYTYSADTSIDGSYQGIQYFNASRNGWQVTWKEYMNWPSYNTMSYLEPGRGYWIWMERADTLELRP